MIGIIVVNNEGVPIKSTLNNSTTSEYGCQVVVNKNTSIFQGMIGTIVVNNEGGVHQVNPGQRHHNSEYDCQFVVNKNTFIFQDMIGTIVVNSEGVPIKWTLF